MTTIQQSFAFVNARFFNLLDQVEAGSVSAVNILNAAGSSVVAKIVPKATFDAAIAIGGVATRVKVPQLPYGMTPQRLGYNGLYQMVKQLRDDNATVESSTKATATYTANTSATLNTYRSGPDGLDLTAKVAGTAANSASLTVVGGAVEGVVVNGSAVTVTLNTGTSDFDSVKATLDAEPTVPFTVVVVGAGATLATTFATANLSGGATGSVVFSAKGSGTVGNTYTITLVNPGVNTATTAATILATAVSVTMRYSGGAVQATLAEIASAVTAASSTVNMTALATGTTSLVAAASGPTALSGGAVGTGDAYIAYDVTRTLRASRQAGLAPTSPVRAVMIPKALADQLSL